MAAHALTTCAHANVSGAPQSVNHTVFSAEPGNLANLHSYKFSGLANRASTVDVAEKVRSWRRRCCCWRVLLLALQRRRRRRCCGAGGAPGVCCLLLLPAIASTLNPHFASRPPPPLQDGAVVIAKSSKKSKAGALKGSVCKKNARRTNTAAGKEAQSVRPDLKVRQRAGGRADSSR